MKTLFYTLAAVLGAHAVAKSEESAPSHDQQHPIVLSIEHVEDAAKPGTFVTCVTCTVREAIDTKTMEATGRAWIELISLPVPGVTPRVFARRAATPNKVDATGRTLFFGFFPGAHGTHSGHWPNLIIEVRPKGAKDETQNVRLSIFRALSAEELADGAKLDDINVPEEYRERIPPPRAHDVLPRKRPVRPIPHPTQPVTPEPKSAPKVTPEAPATPVPKEQPKPRRGAPPQQRGFPTDNVA